MNSKNCFKKIEATVVYVTHDQVEAMTLADRVVVLDQRPGPADRHAR